MDVEQLKEKCRVVARAENLTAIKVVEEELGWVFHDWDIVEVATLMRTLKRKYDPLLTEYLNE